MPWPVSPVDILSIPVDVENDNTEQNKAGLLPTVEAVGPVPLSFPAILRNPGISDHLAHFVQPRGEPGALPSAKKNRRDDKEGKRWVRRKENARFIGNPHIVQASKLDYVVQPTTAKSTFPEPLPTYLPRTAQVPASVNPCFDPNSANAGRFSLSLRGMRRDLKRAGFRAELLVRDIESEILSWLDVSEAILAPDSQNGNIQSPGRPIGDSGSIQELSRTHLQLIWRVADDSFARYVVHCCARYHEVVSFSKDTSGERLTYLLRPNVTRPDAHATRSLATPPTTDIDSSQFDSETDFSERDRLSDIPSDFEVESDSPPDSARLDAIAEGYSSPLTQSWLVVNDSDGADEGDESEIEGILSASIDSLSIDPIQDTPRPNPRPRIRNPDREQIRSNSSPSRSPARMHIRRPRHRDVHPPRSTAVEHKGTLYGYIFL